MVAVDGTGLREIPGQNGDNYVQDWSAAGDWVLFVSTRSGSPEFWVMHSDGSSVTQLTSGPAVASTARWSR